MCLLFTLWWRPWLCYTGTVHTDPPVPRSLVRTTDAVHRGHRPGGAGLCGPHGTGGKGYTLYRVSFALCNHPSTVVHGFPCLKFAQIQITLSHYNSPSLKFGCWTLGQRGKNKTGANIFLYAVLSKNFWMFLRLWMLFLCEFCIFKVKIF